MQIGKYVLEQDTTFHDASFETAAWWQDVKVAAGSYPIFATVGPDGHVQDTSICIALPGVVVAANFCSLWGGMPIGGPDVASSQKIGTAATYYMHPYAHAVARALLFPTPHMDMSRWHLDAAVIRVEPYYTSYSLVQV